MMHETGGSVLVRTFVCASLLVNFSHRLA